MQKDLVLKFRRKEKFKEISLLFYAMNVPFEIRNEGAFKLIIVPERERKNALYQIFCYRKENHFSERVEAESERFDYISYYSIILVFFSFYLFQMIGISFFNNGNLFQIGALSVKDFHNGEWYRVVTALTLHADFLHILSNAFFGGLVTYFVLKKTGTGLGWFLILLSGIMGNLISVLIHDESYIAIGSSTACFGALGVLTGETIFSNKKVSSIIKNSIFLPFASSLAFLGLFGTSAGSDVTAHLFGYISGLFIGILFNPIIKKTKRKIIDNFAGIITGLIILICWWMALKFKV